MTIIAELIARKADLQLKKSQLKNYNFKELDDAITEIDMILDKVK